VRGSRGLKERPLSKKISMAEVDRRAAVVNHHAIKKKRGSENRQARLKKKGKIRTQPVICKKS